MEALLDLCFFVLPNLFIDTNYDDAFNSIVLPLMWNLPIMEYIMKHRVSSRLLLFLARACIMNGDGPTAITFLTRKYHYPFFLRYLLKFIVRFVQRFASFRFIFCNDELALLKFLKSSFSQTDSYNRKES